MSDQIVNVTDATFQQEVVQSEQPVLVDFWAQWCGPCKMIAPIFAEVAAEFDDRVKFVKMDVDANQQTPASLGVRGIPALFLYKNGAVVATKTGACSKAALIAFVSQVLA